MVDIATLAWPMIVQAYNSIANLLAIEYCTHWAYKRLNVYESTESMILTVLA